MTSNASPGRHQSRPDHERERRRDSGLVNGAAAAMLLVGLGNLVVGIVALAAKSTFDADDVIVGSLTVWGTLLIGLGLLELLVAWLIWTRSTLGAVGGLLIGGFGVIFHLFFIGTFPVLSIANIVLDGFIVWVLISRGDEFA